MNHLFSALSVVTLIVVTLWLIGVPIVEVFVWSGNWVKGYYAVSLVIAVYAAYRASKYASDWDDEFNEK